jgi:hypothetical protein
LWATSGRLQRAPPRTRSRLFLGKPDLELSGLSGYSTPAASGCAAEIAKPQRRDLFAAICGAVPRSYSRQCVPFHALDSRGKIMERSTRVRNSFAIRDYDETSSGNENTSDSDVKWTDKLRAHISVPRDKLSNELNALLDTGIIPEVDKVQSRLIKECIELDLPKGQLRVLLEKLDQTLLGFDKTMATSKTVSMLLVSKPENCKIDKIRLRGLDWREEEIDQLNRLINGSEGHFGYCPERLSLHGATFTENKSKKLAKVVRQSESIRSLGLVLNPGNPVPFLKDCFKDNTRLQELSIVRLRLKKGDHESIAAIVFNSGAKLSRLLINECGVDSTAIKSYSTRLKADRKLKNLILSSNPLGVAGCNELIADLKQNTSLRHLALDTCALDDSSGGQLNLNELVQVKGLRYLNLRGNSLTDLSLAPLARELKKNTSLEVLDLSNSKGVGNSSFSAFCQTLVVNKSLISLKLPQFVHCDVEEILSAIMDNNFNLCELSCPNFNPKEREKLSELLGRNQQLLRSSRVAFASGALQYVHQQAYPDVMWNQDIFVNMADVIYSKDGWQAGSLALVNKAALDRAQEAQKKWEDTRLQRLKKPDGAP